MTLTPCEIPALQKYPSTHQVSQLTHSKRSWKPGTRSDQTSASRSCCIRSLPVRTQPVAHRLSSASRRSWASPASITYCYWKMTRTRSFTFLRINSRPVISRLKPVMAEKPDALSDSTRCQRFCHQVRVIEPLEDRLYSRSLNGALAPPQVCESVSSAAPKNCFQSWTSLPPTRTCNRPRPRKRSSSYY